MPTGFSREELRSYARGKRAEYESVLEKIVEIPSVSVEPERKADTRRAAEYAVSLLKSFGGTAEALRDEGPPHRARPLRPRSEATRRSPSTTTSTCSRPRGRTGGRRRSTSSRTATSTSGRGTTDDKGPAITALYGARYAYEQKVPVNIHFLWELEEEIGSPNFETTIRAHAADFATDSVVVSDTVWVSRTRPAAPAGLRGLQGFRFELQTGETDQHSGTAGGAARNPVTELCALIAECVDGKTGRVKIPGFYSDVVAPTKKELEDLKKCGFTVKDFKKDHLFRSLRVNDALEVMKRIWMMPTFEVHGIAGGYQGPGVKTIIPPKATAIVSCRLVPDMNPKKIVKLVKDFVKKTQPRRGRLGRARAAGLPGQDDGPVRRRDPRRDEVRLRQGAGLRARGRLDRRGPLDGEGPEGARVLPRPVAARARLPRAQRELRLAAGRGRDGGVCRLLPAARGAEDQVVVAAGLAPPGGSR